jgi:predicted hotdog family 3-hydroxylacyl-ACP dehydratase
MLSRARTLARGEIEQRIPHHGNMCLLDTVLAWDSDSITCEASSHRAADNPLRAHDRLGAACGVEYAAQAMAVHGALVAENQQGADASRSAPRAGYLASLRGVDLHVDRLDNVPGPLTVRAERVTGDDSTVLYSFSVHDGARALVSGRAVVVLDAAAISTKAAP